MLINKLLADIRTIAIAFGLITFEFLVYTYTPSDFGVEIYLVLVIPYISYLALKDSERSNYMRNFILVGIIAYMYTIFSSMNLLFTESSFLMLLFVSYEVKFNNSKIKMYLFSNMVFIVFYLYRIIYFIFVYNVVVSFTDIMVTNLIIPTFINALIMYLVLNIKLKQKNDFSKARKRFYI